MITIKINDSEPQRALINLVERLQNPRPMLEEIGEYLVKSTKERFASGTAPDGTKWKPNTQATFLEFLRRKGGATVRRGGEKRLDPYVNAKRDKGRLNAKGIAAVMGKKPLIGESRRLMDEFGLRRHPSIWYFSAAGDHREIVRQSHASTSTCRVINLPS